MMTERIIENGVAQSHPTTTLEPIEDADILGWADAVCEARSQIAYAERAAEYAVDGFRIALRRHFAALTTLAEVEQSAGALLELLHRWEHTKTSDYITLDGEVDAATTRILRDMPYADYLQTDHWQAQRSDALERAGHRCQVCNSGDDRLDTHHRTYLRRGEEWPEDLIVLCRVCHETFHNNGRLAK